MKGKEEDEADRRTPEQIQKDVDRFWEGMPKGVWPNNNKWWLIAAIVVAFLFLLDRVAALFGGK